jgi:hypothetical protein
MPLVSTWIPYSNSNQEKDVAKRDWKLCMAGEFFELNFVLGLTDKISKA